MTTQPLLITLFGATGDLAARKLYPAIYRLYASGRLSEQFALIGTARRPWTDEYFRQVVADSIAHLKPQDTDVARFVSHFYYQSHDVNNTEHYVRLEALAKQLDAKYQLDGNRIFYLSTSPTFFPIISQNIKSQHLLGAGFNRLIIEKPFGHDVNSATELQHQLTQTFDENQIYRIDHYLGKEMVQAIYNLRFDNPIFSTIWNKDYIANVQISLPETVGVEERAGYYDTSGATRDMLQNHMLQLLSLLAMAKPESQEPAHIQAAKSRIISNICLYQSLEEVQQHVVRAQYSADANQTYKGYLEEDNVNPHSLTETYFAAKLYLALPEWENVPFYLRTGKRVDQKATIVDIQFKTTTPNQQANHLRIEIAPNLSYTLWLNSKVIGYDTTSQLVPLHYAYPKDVVAQGPDDYERLIFECIKGNRGHFAQWEEVEHAWRYVDLIHHYWKMENIQQLPQYPAGSNGPVEAEQLLVKDGFSWLS